MGSKDNPLGEVTTEERIAQAGLPDLLGSEEEILAAIPVRLSLLIAADERMTELRNNAELTSEQKDTAIRAPEQISREQVARAEAALQRMRHETSAAWWLKHREASIDDLLT